MTKIKFEHIDNFRRSMRSGSKIGSRGVPHHLYGYEQTKYERALKYRYLEVTTKDRVNLKNLWQKVCIAKDWKNYRLEKDQQNGQAHILLNDVLQKSGNTKSMKLLIKTLCTQ